MIGLVVALKCEASPLIRHYKLKHMSGNHLFPLYRNDEICLTISGTGKVMSAAATTHCCLATGMTSDNAWLNIGVAGHSSRSIGEGILAHTIIDDGTGQVWFPSVIIDPACATEQVVTCDRPNSDYGKAGTWDMEAAGFYQAAIRSASTELIHCYKIISDNREETTDTVTAARVEEILQQNICNIDHILLQLEELASQLKCIDAAPADFGRFCIQWHFTVSQKCKLRRLLQRHAVLAPDEPIWSASLDTLKNGRGVLRHLQHRIDSLPISFEK